MTQQRRPDGSLRHLLTLQGLSRTELEALLERAQHFVRPGGHAAAHSDVLAGVTIANIFTEPSTRTRVSFELAAKRRGADVVNLELQLSSRVKGESMLDTVFTLERCMWMCSCCAMPKSWAGHGGKPRRAAVSVLSAGKRIFPPDAGTARRAYRAAEEQRCDGLSIAIVGDIRTRAWRAPPATLPDARGARPAHRRALPLMPDSQEFAGCARSHDIAQALRTATW